jgi:hypothetical protein
MTKAKTTKPQALTAADVLALRDACFQGLALRLKNGMKNPRIGRTEKFFAPDVCEYLAKSGISREALALILSPDVNPTKPLRFGQFVEALQTARVAKVDPGSARGLVALRESQGAGLNTDALIDACMGKQAAKGIDCANLKGVSLQRINKLVSRKVGAGTAPAFVSRSFGRGGFFEMLGAVTVAGSRNASVTLTENPGPLVGAFFALLDGASDRELALMGADLKGGESEE